jgi:hypothetical protein
VSGNNAAVSGNVSIGTVGTDNGIELEPNVSGNSIFWLDDYNNTLRISNGNTPGSYPLTYTNGGNLAVPGTISGTYTGTLSSGNVSAGTFGANTGGGNYNFPASVSVGDNNGTSTYRIYLAGGDLNHSIYSSGSNGNSTYFNEWSAGGSTGWHFVDSNNGTEVFTILGSGNVGIGTTAPAHTLDVAGQVNATSYCISGANCITSWPSGAGATTTAANVSAGTFGSNTGGGSYAFPSGVTAAGMTISGTNPAYVLQNSGTAEGEVALATANGAYSTDAATNDMVIRTTGSNGKILFNTNGGAGASTLAINGGNVGIGTTAPAHTLDVAGQVNATSYCISGANCITSWPSGSFTGGGSANYVPLYTGANALGNSVIYQSGSNIGIGTTGPAAPLQVTGAAKVYNSTGNQYDSNAEIQGTYAGRTVGTGAALGFVVPANTDGSNPWEQGRILVTPDTSNTGDARGRMYLQARGNSGGTWVWENNLVLTSNGNVGVDNTSPNAALDVAGKILAAEGSGTSGGYSFENDGAWDTGMFSPSDGITNFYNNGVQNLQFTPSGGTFYTGMTFNGGLTTSGLTSSGEIIGTLGSGSAQFRAVDGNYGFMIRNDGSNTYFLLTASGSPDAGWNSLRPMAINDSSGDVTFGQNVIINGKLTVPTIDPVYTINGTNYATYGASMTGVNEETDGVATLTRGTNGIYSATIDFATEPTGSSLWLFAQATNLKADLAQLVALITPTFEGKVWYTENTSTESVTLDAAPSTSSIVAGPTPSTVNVSYRFTAPRFDAAHWSNYASSSAKGLVIN